MSKGFLVYTAETLKKINAQRRAGSRPDIYTVPTPSKGEVMFVPSASMGGEPATCYNCHFFNYGKSCMLIGPWTKVKKFTYPVRETADAKPIEYWPCCSMWDRGEPNYGPEMFTAANDPELLGLIWINAPEVGQDIGGASCGGENGGDDCDHYMTEGNDKRLEPKGFCRVLQTTIENGAVCAQWRDDDLLERMRVQDILNDLENPSVKEGRKIVGEIADANT